MFKATQQIQATLKEKNLKCRVEESEKSSRVIANFAADNCNFRVNLISTDDDNDVSFRIYELLRVPKDKKDSILTTINEINCEYRYLKFVIDDNRDINVVYDMPVRTTNPGPVAYELLTRAFDIVDDSYAILMKAIWG